MARLLYRSSQAFMRASLGSMNAETPTSIAAVRVAVSSDPEEYGAVDKVLKVMANQGYVTQEGEGDNATFKITPSGVVVLNALNGGL